MFDYLFLVNDPGGYRAVYPIFKRLINENSTLLLTGTAASINPQYEIDDYMNFVRRWSDDFPNGVLVTGTSWKDDKEICAIEYCKTKRIGTVSIIDYWSNYRERFEYKNDYSYPDYIFIMDEMAKKEAIEEGIPSDILWVVGQPAIDSYIINKKKIKNNGRVLFLSQPIREANGDSLGYNEFTVAKNVVRACRTLGKPLDIKFHPKESDMFMNQFKEYSVEGVIDNLIPNYDVIVGMCTMGLLQSCLMGKKTISYQSGLKCNDLCVTNRLGLTRGAFSYQELLYQMRDEEAWTNQETSSRPLWFDGQSTERCVRCLIDISTKVLKRNVIFCDDFLKEGKRCQK